MDMGLRRGMFFRSGVLITGNNVAAGRHAQMIADHRHRRRRVGTIIVETSSSSRVRPLRIRRERCRPM